MSSVSDSAVAAGETLNGKNSWSFMGISRYAFNKIVYVATWVLKKCGLWQRFTGFHEKTLHSRACTLQTHKAIVTEIALSCLEVPGNKRRLIQSLDEASDAAYKDELVATAIDTLLLLVEDPTINMNPYVLAQDLAKKLHSNETKKAYLEKIILAYVEKGCLDLDSLITDFMACPNFKENNLLIKFLEKDLLKDYISHGLNSQDNMLAACELDEKHLCLLIDYIDDAGLLLILEKTPSFEKIVEFLKCQQLTPAINQIHNYITDFAWTPKQQTRLINIIANAAKNILDEVNGDLYFQFYDRLTKRLLAPLL